PGMPRRCMAASTAASTAAARPGGRAETPGVTVGAALAAGEGAGDEGAGEATTVGEAGVRGFDASAVTTAAIDRKTAPSPGYPIRPGLLQPVPILQLLRHVLLGDEADAQLGERFDLELQAAPHHLLDLTLPVRLLEPGIGEH